MRKLFWTLAAGLLLGAAVIAQALYASLPRRDGVAAIPGLTAQVDIELDAFAVPRIRAASLEDAFRAQGFIHAQDRFFQMDLIRRSAAGELAALVGPALLPADLERRAFQPRKRAQALLDILPDAHRGWLFAYVDGVNAGLADLGARPPEYWLLRAKPAPWTAEDSLLVFFALYAMLSNNQVYERPQAVMEAALSADVVDFLTPSASRFDRPLGTLPDDPTGGYAPLPVPATAFVGLPPPPDAPTLVVPPPAGGASNGWSIGAERTADGIAILANDPHLELRLPNVFHRAELHWPEHVVRGAGIAGVPGIFVGANADVAWGVTVSYADQADWVVIEPDPANPNAYRVPGGSEPYLIEHESIEVRGGEPVSVTVKLTRWGPIAGEDGLGRPLALKATWLEPGGADLGVLDLAFARSVADALDIVSGWAGPSLSWMFADRDGRVGWAVNGPLPKREGFDGAAPRSWADGAAAWRGYSTPPRLEGGPHDTLYTANSRLLPLDESAALGAAAMPAFRAKRIADRLAEQRHFDEADFVALQLDTRAEAYDAIRDVVLEVLEVREEDPVLRAARAHIEAWNGRADAQEVGFRLLHTAYRAFGQALLGPLLAPARALDPTFAYRWPLGDEPLRRLLDERPAHLLPPGHADWPDYLRQVVVQAIRALETDPSRPGPDAPWGEANRLSAEHALADLPLIGPLLKLPDVPQSGSPVSVRVAEPTRGAVIRMVVSPARPERGVLQLAGGQSGHFLSRHFDDQWPAWRDGAPTPFLAGDTVAAFKLAPPGAGASVERHALD